MILPTDGAVGLKDGDYLRLGPVCLNFILPKAPPKSIKRTASKTGIFNPNSA